MPGKLTRDACAQLIAEDIEWLMKQPRDLEREHIRMILDHAVEHEYNKPFDSEAKDDEATKTNRERIAGRWVDVAEEGFLHMAPCECESGESCSRCEARAAIKWAVNSALEYWYFGTAEARAKLDGIHEAGLAPSCPDCAGRKEEN